MAQDVPAHPSDSSAAVPTPRPAELLVLDDEPEVRHVLDHMLAGDHLRIHHAGSLDAARRIIAEQRIDAAVVDLRLPDGDGLELARELSGNEPAVPTVVLAGDLSRDDLVRAMRAGACDAVAKPFEIHELTRAIERALQRRRESRRLTGRVRRLRRLCRQLNQARIETTQQVDVLCSDLVTAYHELAGQFKHVQLTTRFAAMVEPELSLEQLLHQTLEFILQHIGSTNAAIFLPGQSENFTTGGYVNYTFEREAASVILPQLAERVAPRIAEQEEGLLHLTSDEAIAGWIDDEGDMANLDGSHVAAFPCVHEDETLAGVCLFRDADEPYDPDRLEALAGIAPILARQLARIIHVHHRFDD